MKMIKLNYDWMLLDVSIPAEELDSTVKKESKYAPEGKGLYVFALRADSSHYSVFAYTFVDRRIYVEDDLKYQEDTQLLTLHYKRMFGNI